jgi:hypothetical protein
LVAGLFIFSVPGCGQPQVEPQHRRLILGLATATSAQKSDWLEQTASEIDAARKSGQLSETTDRVFTQIVQLARAGDWQRARELAYALRDAQRPTPEDIQRVQQRQMPEPKLPPRRPFPQRP